MILTSLSIINSLFLFWRQSLVIQPSLASTNLPQLPKSWGQDHLYSREILIFKEKSRYNAHTVFLEGTHAQIHVHTFVCTIVHIYTYPNMCKFIVIVYIHIDNLPTLNDICLELNVHKLQYVIHYRIWDYNWFLCDINLFIIRVKIHK